MAESRSVDISPQRVEKLLEAMRLGHPRTRRARLVIEAQQKRIEALESLLKVVLRTDLNARL